MKEQGYTDTRNLNAGEEVMIQTDINMKELKRSKFSNQTLHVTSNNNISVLAISQRGESIQTMVVPPLESLGTEYHVPLIPEMKPTQPQIDPRNRLFSLIIINHKETNKVTISGPAGEDKTVSLQPFQLVQLWLNRSLPEPHVSADHPVAVLYGHPCATVTNCTCSFLFNPLYPVTAWGSEYLVHPSFENGALNETTFLLTTNQSVSLLSGPPTEPLQLQSSHELPFNPFLPGGSSLVKTSSPVSLTLLRPGLLLSLIPTHSFSSCYLLHSLNAVKNQALLVAPTAQTEGVHQGNTALDVTWTPMMGTEYSWALIDFGTEYRKHVIWHSSSKMAAYYLGEVNGMVFGNPADSLSTDPDSKGCLLRPEVVSLGDEQGGWPESLKYCQDQGYSLVSLNTEDFLLHVTNKLMESGTQAQGQTQTQGQVWIGLRRSSLTGQWYWLSKAAVSFTHWAKGEPGTPMQGQCTMMTLDPQGNYTWSDKSCCEALPAVCYREPLHFPLE
ncbi:hypothetical protein J4Q44_G00393300 [Coregonus suidteri]|uniref:C-type lectin domain-containing protein n=1 Tax=Coregonus suidteri TaxID=861788 RepID=A0AAN8K7W5_9TELE